MIKYLLWCFSFIILPFLTLSQEYLFAFEQKTNEEDQIISIVDEENKNLIVFLDRDKDVIGYHLDSAFNEVWNFKSNKPEKFRKCLMGAVIKKDNVAIYYSNKNFSGISCVNLNLKNYEISKNIINLKIKNERYLASEVVNDKLYILSIVNNNSILRLYEFDSENHFNDYTFDFVDNKFVNTTYKFSLYNLMELEDVFLQKVSSEIPTSIELITNLNKVYFLQDKIILSFDTYKDLTKLIIINLENYESSIEDYSQYTIRRDKLISGRSNSFLYQDKIFQLNTSTLEMALTIRDLKSKEILTQYIVEKEDSIFFKNTPATHEYTSFPWDTEKKELQNTNDILRKITQYGAGISVLKLDDILEISLGGLKKSAVSKVVTQSVGIEEANSSSNNFTTRINPNCSYYPQVTYNFQSYTQSKSFKLKIGLYANSFEHIQETLNDNIFDELKYKLEENVKNFLVKLIFKMEEDYYIVYFNKTDKKHYLVKIS